MTMPVWEMFLDHGYYDMYAVRISGERNFKKTIHVMTKEEAEYIRDKFNELEILRWVKEE